MTKKKVDEPATVKKVKKKPIIIGAVVFVSLFVWWAILPVKGTIQYGVCKTFAELRLKYPTTLQVNSMNIFDRSLRIYYTYVDGYGQNRMELIECTFKADPTYPDVGFALEAIAINRVPVPQEEIRKFNETLPGIIKYPPDLILPPANDALKGLIINNMSRPIL